jgi:hypothetical protein
VADTGLPDAQVTQGGQDRGAQAGQVPVDGLRLEAFLCRDLVNPRLGEFVEACLSGDLVVVGCGAVAQLDLQRPNGGRAGGVGGLDVTGGAVVVAEPGSGAEPFGSEFHA